MNTKLALVAALSTIFLTLPARAAFEPPAWKFVKSDDGIKIYEREVAGSDVLEFGGDGNIDAPLAKVASVIFDAKRAPEWMKDLDESKVVRWVDSDTFVEYDHIGTPFILKDRDFVSQVSIALDKTKKQLKFVYHSIVDPSLPETSYVRGDLKNTTFILTEIDGGKRTHVEGEIHCDPMGSIPKWIVNLFQKDWPVDTLEGLRKQVKKPDVKADPRFARYVQALEG